MYDLYAISNHFGGMGGGHYTACCKLNEDGQWFYYDDTSTYPIRTEKVVTEAAYVLFYRRRSEGQQDAGANSSLSEKVSFLLDGAEIWMVRTPKEAAGSSSAKFALRMLRAQKLI